MKFSKKILLKLKNKNKRLKPDRYKVLKREKLRGVSKGNSNRPRLSIFRSNENIYAQIIDDTKSQTLISFSTLDRLFKVKNQNRNCCEASKLIGQKLAKKSLKKNITKIVFDRGLYLYHGRIKALAEGAREGGLNF